MRIHDVHFPQDALGLLCQQFGVSRLCVFGSILTDRFGPKSDVDMLVEFAPGHGPGLFGFAGLELELTKLVGREVHLQTPAMLGPILGEEVLKTARVQYAA